MSDKDKRVDVRVDRAKRMLFVTVTLDPNEAAWLREADPEYFEKLVRESTEPKGSDQR